MTKLERVKAAFRHDEPDRVPVFDLLFNDVAIEHYTGQKLTVKNGREVVLQAIRATLDMTRGIRFPQKPCTKRDDRGFVYRIERWTEWIVGRPFHTLREAAQYVERDLEKKLRHRQSREEAQAFKEEAREMQSALGDTVVLWNTPSVALFLAHMELGMDLFVYLDADQPELVSEWLEAIHGQQMAWLKATLVPELSPAGIIYADIAWKKGPMFSPPQLERRGLFRHVADMCDLFHENNMWAVFHSDGNLWEIMDRLVEAAIDGINPNEPESGMCLKDLKAQYGDRLALVGGLDAGEILGRGTPEQVREAVIQALHDAGPGGGLFLGSSTELGPQVRGENAIVMIEAIKEHGHYPIR